MKIKEKYKSRNEAIWMILETYYNIPSSKSMDMADLFIRQYGLLKENKYDEYMDYIYDMEVKEFEKCLAIFELQE